jgi:hypothetical protein
MISGESFSLSKSRITEDAQHLDLLIFLIKYADANINGERNVKHIFII